MPKRSDAVTAKNRIADERPDSTAFVPLTLVANMFSGLLVSTGYEFEP